MVRIGVFIDALEGSIPVSFRGRILRLLGQRPDVAFVEEVENLLSPEGRAAMGKRLGKGDADRIVIVGASPKAYEASFQKSGYPSPLNPYLFAVANIREQALWPTANENAAFKKAESTIFKTMDLVSHTKPIETVSLPLSREVLIIGGGVVGIAIALSLADSGIRVTILERENDLGGNLLGLRTFYDRPEGVGPWLGERVAALKQNPNVTILTGSQLKRVDGHVGRFQTKIRGRDGKESILSASAIVVATGYRTGEETSGIRGHRRIVSLSEMERILSEATGDSVLIEGKKVGMVTFLLDEVNEDIKIDSIHAMKQASSLQGSLGCQVAFLCKDVKVAADGMERLYRKAREQGVLFFKYEEPPRLSLVNGSVQVDVRDSTALRKAEQTAVSILSDLVVVSEAFRPSEGLDELARILNIHVGRNGFLMEDNPQFARTRTNRRGIYLAGACRFPQEVSESLIEAKAASEDVLSLFAGGAYVYDLSVAEVDPRKCAVCYTCPRLCPHAAITVERYPEENVYRTDRPGAAKSFWAARVDPAACYGCGICVAECPAKAITLRHQRAEQVYAQMALDEKIA